MEAEKFYSGFSPFFFSVSSYSMKMGRSPKEGYKRQDVCVFIILCDLSFVNNIVPLPQGKYDL